MCVRDGTYFGCVHERALLFAYVHMYVLVFGWLCVSLCVSVSLLGSRLASLSVRQSVG